MEKHETVDILLVEDNQHEAQLTIRSFKKSNLTDRLLHLSEGSEALDFLFCNGKYARRNIGNIPKLILLDLNIPKVSGLDVLRALKKDLRTKVIPIVVLTSSKEDSDIIASYQLGVNSYIVKPVNADSFAKAVTDVGLYWMFLNVPP